MRAIVLFAPYALALLIPPPTLLSGNLTLTSSRANDRAANVSTRGATACLPDIYGVGLNAQSCINAMGKIPRTVLPNVYGTRGFPGISIMIPIRYQSDDGRCAITLRLRNRDSAGRDVTRSIEVADAAKDVINRCTVTRNVMSGGSTSGFSLNNELTVTVSKYESTAVCDTYPQGILLPTACESLLREIPSSQPNTEFVGPGDNPSYTGYSRLPKIYVYDTAIGPVCKIFISRDPASGSSTERWFNIWAAGVDIMSTCVQHGMAGSVSRLGYKEGGEHMIGIIDFVLPLRLLYSFWWKISKSHAHDRVLQETIGRFKSASVIAFSRTPRIFVDQKCVASSLGHAGTTSKLVAGADLSGPTARKTPYREDQRKIIFNPDKPRLLDNLATGNHGEFSSRVVLVSSRLNSDTRLAQARYSAVVRSDKNPNLLRAKGGRPFLDYTLRPNIVTPTRLPQLIEFIDFDMVRLLLDKGANPNKKVSIYGNITVWALFLLSCYEKKDIKNSPAKDTSFKAAELMVRKGAHRKLKLETTRRETIGNRSDAVTLAKTAKYKKVVTRGGMIEVDVPVELAAVSILAEIFGDGKIACLKDQIGVVGT